ncbi:M-phase inducer phosphatase 3 [Ciconia maguari]
MYIFLAPALARNNSRCMSQTEVLCSTPSFQETVQKDSGEIYSLQKDTESLESDLKDLGSLIAVTGSCAQRILGSLSGFAELFPDEQEEMECRVDSAAVPARCPFVTCYALAQIFFLKKPHLPSMPQKRLILVFHREFSSERAPKMCRYLRKEDRAMSEYPALHYPELYVLKRGYKDFFPEYKELCEPQRYCPIHHQDFKVELLKFRAKSKSWTMKRRKQDQITHLMKR